MGSKREKHLALMEEKKQQMMAAAAAQEIEAQPRIVVTENYKMTTDMAGIVQHLESQLYDLRRKFEWCSPILTIQKTAKRCIYRKRFLKKKIMTKLLVWSLNRWNLRLNLERFMKG